ncbi:MAG TPA: hypothetical protein VIZ28_00475 [Chitinophagaceae bacterium]
MKHYLLPVLVLAILSCNSNKNPVSAEERTENIVSSPAENEQASSAEIIGQWKRTAAGKDANKNRILDENEKMPLEPGAHENLDFYKDKKCKVYGMGMELEATYAVKNDKGKKEIFIYVKGEAPDDQSAMKFEIVSAEPNKLVLVPPIYEFMLAAYTKVK